MQKFILLLFFQFLFVFPVESIEASSRLLLKNNVQILVPEPKLAVINPFPLRTTDEDWFNQKVFPEIIQLHFFSNTKNAWFPIPYENIVNDCFARRTLVDLFLWGETNLRGHIEYSESKIKYLTPFLREQDFLNYSWIETAKIQVVGKLKVGSIKWSNHEAVIIHTNNGVRVIDPSFAPTTLLLDEWFLNFAPEEMQKTCVETDAEGLMDINMEMVKELYGSEWNPIVPKCGYIFRQRLDAGDMISGTIGMWETDLEKMLSRNLKSYMEDKLLPK